MTVDAGEVLAHLANRLGLGWLVQIPEPDLSERARADRRSHLSRQLFLVAFDDKRNVEIHDAFHVLVDSSCAYTPAHREPACSTLHSDPKFREPTPLGWRGRCYKRSIIVVNANPAGVVPHTDRPVPSFSFHLNDHSKSIRRSVDVVQSIAPGLVTRKSRCPRTRPAQTTACSSCVETGPRCRRPVGC